MIDPYKFTQRFFIHLFQHNCCWSLKHVAQHLRDRSYYDLRISKVLTQYTNLLTINPFTEVDGQTHQKIIQLPSTSLVKFQMSRQNSILAWKKNSMHIHQNYNTHSINSSQSHSVPQQLNSYLQKIAWFYTLYRIQHNKSIFQRIIQNPIRLRSIQRFL